MVLKIIHVFIPVVVIVVLGACFASDNKSAKSSKVNNPNGSSELAILMNRMFDESLMYRENLEIQNENHFTFDPAVIFTAKPTDQNKVESKEYQLMGRAYIAAMNALLEASPEERLSHFQGMVHTCMACHEKVCRGPMDKIKKLYIEEMTW